MSICGFIQPYRLYSGRGGRQIAAPTVTLVGGTVHSRGLYMQRCLAMNHRRYIAWYRSTAQVLFETQHLCAHCLSNISRRPAALIRLAQASQLPPREALVPCFWAAGQTEPAIDAAELSTVNCQLSTSGKLSIVHCQLSIFSPPRTSPLRKKASLSGSFSVIIPDSGAWLRPRQC